MSYPTAGELVAALRQLSNGQANIDYVWWQEGDPIPMWSYTFPSGPPTINWLRLNGIMCSDAINYARQVCGLPPIGGTPAYYDWMQANGAIDYDPDTPGVPGALIVNPGVWRGGQGQGHIAMYTGEHRIIQSSDGQGAYQGVHEEEMDYESDDWWSPWLYGLMPDVDYSSYLLDPPEPEPALAGPPRWHAIDEDGYWRADGPDWSRGWFGMDPKTKTMLPNWRGPNDA